MLCVPRFCNVVSFILCGYYRLFNFCVSGARGVFRLHALCLCVYYCYLVAARPIRICRFYLFSFVPNVPSAGDAAVHALMKVCRLFHLPCPLHARPLRDRQDIFPIYIFQYVHQHRINDIGALLSVTRARVFQDRACYCLLRGPLALKRTVQMRRRVAFASVSPPPLGVVRGHQFADNRRDRDRR